MTLLIVDADHISYRAAASCSPTKSKPFQEDLNEALWRLDTMVEQLVLAYNDPDMEFYISGEGNWRYAIYPEYKANRKNTVPPQWLQECRERLVMQYKARIVNDREVDDMCGIRMSQEANNMNKVVCASLDKDLRQVPGYHYKWQTNHMGSIKPAEEVLVSPLDGLRNFYKQVITGDAADHIPAFDNKFRTATPQFVQKLLVPLQDMTEEGEMWEHIKDIYSEQVSWADDWLTVAERNASVLYVQKYEEDKWTPPCSSLEVI